MAIDNGPKKPEKPRTPALYRNKEQKEFNPGGALDKLSNKDIKNRSASSIPTPKLSIDGPAAKSFKGLTSEARPLLSDLKTSGITTAEGSKRPSSPSALKMPVGATPKVTAPESTPFKAMTLEQDVGDLSKFYNPKLPKPKGAPSASEARIDAKSYQAAESKVPVDLPGMPQTAGKLAEGLSTKEKAVKIPKAKSSVVAKMDGPMSKAINGGKGVIDRFKEWESLNPISADSEYSTNVQKSHAFKLRYRIPSKLERLFTEEPEKLKKLGSYITDQIRLSDSERNEFFNRLVKYRQAWKDFVSAGLDPAFEGAHNVHVPLMYANIKAMHARIFQAVLGVQPPFSLRPRNPVPETMKEDKEQLLRWVINDYANMQQGWDSAIDDDIWNFVADGKAITKQYWLRDVRKFTDVEEQVRRPIELDADGFPVVDEKEVEKEEVVWDCPILETVPLEDFWIIGKKSWDIDKADLIDHMQDYSKSDLIKAARLGFFYKDVVDEIIEYNPAGGTETGTLNRDLKMLEDFTSGIDKSTSQAGIKTYKIHECYLRYDIDDDGIDEELVVWVEGNCRKVLRITYLERVGPGGKRPFTLKLFTPDGKGLGELLYGLNNEIDYIHNQRLDYGTLQNLPFFFYRAASGLNPVQLKVGPGSGIPVDDPQGDVMFPRLGGGTAYGFQEEAQVSRYAEKVSVPEFAFGSMAAQGATRTATGTAALVNELNANIDIHIKRYQRGFKRNLYILDLQCQDLLPLGMVIRVGGVDGKEIYKRFEDRGALRFACDFELTANSVSSNKAIERETAQMLMQMLANPIALQTGIATQGNLYNAFKNVLQKFEVQNVDAYITKPADSPDSPYTAKDEINMIIAGVKPPLVIKDRHAEKLALFDAFEKSDDFSWLTEAHIPLYREVRQYHEQAVAAINSQAANPLLQQGIMDLNLSANLAAGGGAPQVAQQQSDLAQAGGQARQEPTDPSRML